MAASILINQVEANTTDVNENAVQFIVDWVLANRSYFGANAIGTCLGFTSETGNTAYIFPSMLNQALTKAGYSPRKTMKYMAEKDLIATDIDRKTGSASIRSLSGSAPASPGSWNFISASWPKTRTPSTMRTNSTMATISRRHGSRSPSAASERSTAAMKTCHFDPKMLLIEIRSNARSTLGVTRKTQSYQGFQAFCYSCYY